MQVWAEPAESTNETQPHDPVGKAAANNARHAREEVQIVQVAKEIGLGRDGPKLLASHHKVRAEEIACANKV